MATETYKYFQPEAANLRSAYGGGAIQNGGDSAEVDPLTLTQRYICRELNLPANGTHWLFQGGVDGSANIWIRVSDNTYSAISSFLTASETSSVTSSAPSGFTVSTRIPYFQPKVRRKNLFVIGDSLSAGVSAAGALNDAVSKLALDIIQTTTEYATEPADRCWFNDTWALCNLALGASSFANTDSGGGEAVYPQRFDLAFDQRFRTLALNGTTENYIHIWLGTNDITYDSTQTGASVWARAETAIDQLKTEFPSVPIIIGTCIRRSESTTLNGKLNDYNVLMRANYLSAGADYLVDYETANPSFNTLTGNSGDTSVYAGDGVHLITAGYQDCAEVLEPILSTL